MIFDSEKSMWTTWYCRGCKQNTEALCKPEDEVVKCPNCGAEKKRYSAPDLPA